MSKFERLHLILNLIRSRPGIGARELASEANVSQRTIYRDILALAGQYPVLYDKGYRVLPTAFLKTLNFTKSEYTVLQTALSCPALKRPDLKIVARSLKAKIDTVVSPVAKTSALASYFFCTAWKGSESDLRKLQTLCSVLEKAIEHSQIIEFTSPRGSEGKAELIYPYSLAYCPIDWYLIAYSPRIKDFQRLKLKPTCRISLTGQKFKRDEAFNFQEFFHSRWGMKGGEIAAVKVSFTGEAALEVMADSYHPSEKVIKVGDNECIYVVSVKGTDEILRWILGFGPEAEVLLPITLRDKIAKMAKSMTKLYSKDGCETDGQKTILTRD